MYYHSTDENTKLSQLLDHIIHLWDEESLILGFFVNLVEDKYHLAHSESTCTNNLYKSLDGFEVFTNDFGRCTRSWRNKFN
jgi:hypothetical protein